MLIPQYLLCLHYAQKDSTCIIMHDSMHSETSVLTGYTQAPGPEEAKK